MIDVQITKESDDDEIDADLLRAAVRHVLHAEGIAEAQIGVAIVDDRAIHELNRKFLEHDYPTDVITFPLASEDNHLEGEIAASIDTARRQAAEFGCPPGDELLLYVVHGALHLVGFDDTTAEAKQQMHEKEHEALAHFGRVPYYDEQTTSVSPNQ
jgi:probable rRNA maturation factor